MARTLDPRTVRLVHMVSEKVAGEVVLSPEPGRTIRKWRDTFGASQQALAQQMGVSPSVIADYESGRRKSPGVMTVRRLVNAMVEHDLAQGGPVLRRLSAMFDVPQAIIDIRELNRSVAATEFVEAIDGTVIAGEQYLDRDLKGYTVLDAVKAIIHLSSLDYGKVFGWTTERALIFSGVLYGRSPMVAVRVYPMKPAMVVFHRSREVDPLAMKLAEVERLPLVRTDVAMPKLLERLNELEGEP